MNPFNDKNLNRFGFAAGIATVAIAAYAMVAVCRFNANAPAATASRDEQRTNALADIHAAAERSLQTYGWQNMEKGVIYIPIERAMQLTAVEWKNPAWGRSNLMFRASIALEVPPPPEAVTNEYE